MSRIHMVTDTSKEPNLRKIECALNSFQRFPVLLYVEKAAHDLIGCIGLPHYSTRLSKIPIDDFLERRAEEYRCSCRWIHTQSVIHDDHM
jgi:hypothetical protein